MENRNRAKIQLDPLSDNFKSIVILPDNDVVVTTAQLIKGIFQAAPTGSVTITLPSAAQLIKEWPLIPISGYSRVFTIRNDSANAIITLVPGKGGSVNGSDVISASKYAAHYRLRFSDVTSGVESYVIVRE
jgi:hypothetical protein